MVRTPPVRTSINHVINGSNMRDGNFFIGLLEFLNSKIKTKRDRVSGKVLKIELARALLEPVLSYIMI